MKAPRPAYGGRKGNRHSLSETKPLSQLRLRARTGVFVFFSGPYLHAHASLKVALPDGFYGPGSVLQHEFSSHCGRDLVRERLQGLFSFLQFVADRNGLRAVLLAFAASDALFGRGAVFS